MANLRNLYALFLFFWLLEQYFYSLFRLRLKMMICLFSSKTEIYIFEYQFLTLSFLILKAFLYALCIIRDYQCTK